MNSVTCCLTRVPPSPDAAPPRPAIPSPPAFKLNETFSEFFAASWSSGSRLSKPEDAAAIQAIFEGDKLSNDGGSEKAVSRKRSSTLSAVKTHVKSRLKKHLSKDSGITNTQRQSRASVGTTEEETERRAELRRIRHKRIQQELSQEENYDEDAKSVSAIDAQVGPHASGPQEMGSWKAGDPLSWPVLDPPSLPTLVLPSLTPDQSPPLKVEPPPMPIFNQKGPMLEALYYGLSTPQTPTTRLYAEAYFSEMSTAIINSSKARSRRHSAPSALLKYDTDKPIVYQDSRRRSSLPAIPPASVLETQSLPSVIGSGKSSWRLSFSAKNRGDQLRKLSQAANTPVFTNIEMLVGAPQGMRAWCRSQGLRPPSQGLKGLEDDPNLHCAASHAHNCKLTSSQDFGGVDGVSDVVGALQLHESSLPQELASKGRESHFSSPQSSEQGSHSHELDASGNSDIPVTALTSRAQRVLASTDSRSTGERNPQGCGEFEEKGVQDSTSSFYPSGNVSLEVSRKSSRFSLFSMLPGSKSKADQIELKGKLFLSLNDLLDMELSPFTSMTPASPQAQVRFGSTPLASVSSDSHPLPPASFHRRPTIDANSIAVSETESFREREAELIAVKTRFATTKGSRTSSTPRSSKFREEFDFPTTCKKAPPLKKPSAFSRLSKFAARSFDGSFERKTTAVEKQAANFHRPSTAFGKRPTIALNNLDHVPEDFQHHGSPGTSLAPCASSLEGGRIPGTFEKATHLLTDSNTKDATSDSHVLRTEGHQDAPAGTSYGVRNTSRASRRSKESKEKKQEFIREGLGWRVGEQDSFSDPEKEAGDIWEAELAKVVQKARGRSKNIVKRPIGPDRRYPASWSRYPSHDRQERTSSAGAKDRVDAKDFANIAQIRDDGQKSLRKKIQEGILAGYEKHAFKHAVAEVQLNAADVFGRKSSIFEAGDLDWPELEILALHNVSLMTHEDIEDHVKEVMRQEEMAREEEELARKQAELEAIFGPAKRAGIMRRLTERINTIARKVSGGGGTTTVQTKTGSSSALTETTEPRGPTARRGPIARQPGEGSSTPEPAPNVVTLDVTPARARAEELVDSRMDQGDEEFVITESGDSEFEDTEISIADPRFYDDCIVNSTPGLAFLNDGEHEGFDDMSGTMSSNPWIGRGGHSFRHPPKNRRSVGMLKVRKSTDEIVAELKKAEVAERDNALKAAEEAWGGL